MGAPDARPGPSAGRPRRNAEAALTAAAAHGLGEPQGLEGWARAQRRTGRWALARRTAERMRTADAAGGSFCLAFAVGGREGAQAARPVWREAARLPAGRELTADASDFLHAVIAAGLEDWPGLDARLTGLLSGPREWIDVAWLADLLEQLLHTPGTDAARLTARGERVREARDGIRARYSHQ
ncbi:hypothetical protein [Streptomyces avermitilis]|uniref:hypothetical protein n=1 Tax=Streptomyces avermitilis TaxID=33903 RepID=UPI0036A1E25D